MTTDVLIIGAGHNGLVCAFYLARRGYKVTMLEARSVVGGAAVTEEFHPGFRNSTAAYTVSLLNPQVIRDMRLYDHGLEVVLRKIDNFLPTLGADYLLAGRDGLTRREIARHSPADAENYDAYSAALNSVVGILRQWLLRAPPNAGGGLADILALLKLGAGVNRLSLEEQRHLLDFFTKSAATYSTAISATIWSRPCSASTASSAITPARMRRAPPTSCSTMSSARRRASQGVGPCCRRHGRDHPGDGSAALEALAQERFDLVLSDLNMPGNMKLELLRTGRTNWPDIPLIVVTGAPSLPTAIESVRLGITDYLLKPVKFEDLLSSIRRALAHRKQPRTGTDTKDSASSGRVFPEIIGESPPMTGTV